MHAHPIILHVETSTNNCSVSVSAAGQVIGHVEKKEIRDHAAQIASMVDKTLLEAQLTYALLDAISISIGPGSYTGLRIGLSYAKGLCLSLNIPLIHISTLACLGGYWF